MDPGWNIRKLTTNIISWKYPYLESEVQQEVKTFHLTLKDLGRQGPEKWLSITGSFREAPCPTPVFTTL